MLSFKIKDESIKNRLVIAAAIMGNDITDMEVNVLTALMEYSDNSGMIALSPTTSKEVKAKSKCKTNSFGACLFKLDNKRMIKKSGVVIIINPVILKICTEKSFVIAFGDK